MKKYPKTFNSSNMIRAVILLILLIYIFVVLYITLVYAAPTEPTARSFRATLPLGESQFAGG